MSHNRACHVAALVLTACIAVANAYSKPIAPLGHHMRCGGCHIVTQTIFQRMDELEEKAKKETVLVGGRMQKNAKQARKKKYFGTEARLAGNH